MYQRALAHVATAPPPVVIHVNCSAGCAVCGFMAFAVLCTDEKDGLKVSLKESNQLIEEGKQREVQLQSKLNSMEQQVNVLTGRDQEASSALMGRSVIQQIIRHSLL